MLARAAERVRGVLIEFQLALRVGDKLTGCSLRRLANLSLLKSPAIGPSPC